MDRLKEAIAALKQEISKENLDAVLDLLMEASVWVPCVLVLYEQKGLEEEEIITGAEFSDSEGRKLRPELMTGGEELYLPAFTSQEEMGDYGRVRIGVQKSVFEVIDLAEQTEKQLKGIVINPFSEVFILDGQMLDALLLAAEKENMKS